jgi:hypothetical protein
MPKGAKTDRHSPPLIQGLRVQEADGGEIALRHNLKLLIEGPMPDGRRNSVEMLVASIPALLVMKGYALVGRDKKKDSYDIYFSVRNYEKGLDELAEACRPLLGDREIAARQAANLGCARLPRLRCIFGSRQPNSSANKSLSSPCLRRSEVEQSAGSAALLGPLQIRKQSEICANSI